MSKKVSKKRGVGKGLRAKAINRCKLDHRTVGKLPIPESGPPFWWDDGDIPRFGVKCYLSKSGRVTRTFVIGYRNKETGKSRLKTIGPVSMGLSKARGEAELVRAEVAVRKDPVVADRENRQREREAGYLVADLGADFLSKGRSVKRGKRGQPWRDTTRAQFTLIVERYITPELGKLSVSDLTTARVRELIAGIEKRGKTMANRVLSVLRLMYSWGKIAGLVTVVPEWPERPSDDQRRTRVLNDDEIRRALPAMDAEKVLGPAFRLMLLTGQRRGEVLSMRWQDIVKEPDGRWWIIPGEFVKNGQPHRVPLSPQAVSVLAAVRNADRKRGSRSTRRKSKWVFPSPGGKLPITNPQRPASRVWTAAGLKGDAHIHDLRRTAASLMAGLTGDRFIVGVVLNHSDRGNVTSIYDRHSYDPEKRRALTLLGERIEVIAEGKKQVAKVIKMRASARRS